MLILPLTLTLPLSLFLTLPHDCDGGKSAICNPKYSGEGGWEFKIKNSKLRIQNSSPSSKLDP